MVYFRREELIPVHDMSELQVGFLVGCAQSQLSATCLSLMSCIRLVSNWGPAWAETQLHCRRVASRRMMSSPRRGIGSRPRQRFARSNHVTELDHSGWLGTDAGRAAPADLSL